MPNALTGGSINVFAGAILAVQAQTANAPNGWTAANIDALTAGNGNLVFARLGMGIDVVGSDTLTRSAA